MIYEYRCDGCGSFESQTRANAVPCSCGMLARRKWGFQRTDAFKPHFNHAVGQYVTSDKQFKDALKRSAEVSGTSFAPIYPGDVSPKGDTQTLENQAREWHDRKARGDPLVQQEKASRAI